jgi:hypothetical protein
MDALEALIRDLPEGAERIRRRFWRDPEFRGICEDYRDSLEAANRFQALQPPDPARVTQYRQLAAELLTEAAEILKEERS